MTSAKIAPRPGFKSVVFAQDQPEYIPLPALKGVDGTVVMAWELSWRERVKILLGHKLFLSMLTFNQPLQPVKLSVGVE